ncbi:MAG: 50S ribosomal protein L13 [Patescibacteria group bacterium]|nr:50S ribosomal protein L13 [Patescibacteria group bacterium]
MKSSKIIKKQKTKVEEPRRETHEFDLEGKVFGRAASEVALLLSGKRKVEFVPYIDAGDFVCVYNLGKMKIRGGNKLKDKAYYHYSGYPGGIKKAVLVEELEKDPDKVFRRAVFGMLPKNSLRKEMIKRLKTNNGPKD